MKQVELGNQGLIVPTIGLGCMGMTGYAGGDVYGKADEKEAIATIHRSLELGGNFLDTADLYGPFLNEKLIEKAIRGNREKYIIATKFGFEIDDVGLPTGKINGTKAYVKKSIERSLKNLHTDHIDLYYLHRLDKNTPIEETVDAMADLVKEGKISYVGLSEVSAATIRKAHAVHPITAVQNEYSLFERNLEVDGIDQTIRELGIGLIAYSPLGRGFLSGQFKTADAFPENDVRKSTPKFQGDQLLKNVAQLQKIEKIAEEKNITSSQLAIAWTISKGAVPIPGTKKLKYINENIAATEVVLSVKDMETLENIIPLAMETGDRYDEGMMQLIDR